MRLLRLLQPERVWGWTIVPPGPRLDPSLQSRGTARRAPRPRCLPAHPLAASRPEQKPAVLAGPPPGHQAPVRRPWLSPLPSLSPGPPEPPSTHPPTHGPSRGAGAWKAARSLFPFPPRAAPPLPLTACSHCPSAAVPPRRSRGLPPRLPRGAVGAERQAARGTLVRLLHGGGNPAGPTCSLLHTPDPRDAGPAPQVPGFGEFCRERAGRGLAKASSWPPGRRSLSFGQRV